MFFLICMIFILAIVVWIGSILFGLFDYTPISTISQSFNETGNLDDSNKWHD